MISKVLRPNLSYTNERLRRWPWASWPRLTNQIKRMRSFQGETSGKKKSKRQKWVWGEGKWEEKALKPGKSEFKLWQLYTGVGDSGRGAQLFVFLDGRKGLLYGEVRPQTQHAALGIGACVEWGGGKGHLPNQPDQLREHWPLMGCTCHSQIALTSHVSCYGMFSLWWCQKGKKISPCSWHMAENQPAKQVIWAKASGGKGCCPEGQEDEYIGRGLRPIIPSIALHHPSFVYIGTYCSFCPIRQCPRSPDLPWWWVMGGEKVLAHKAKSQEKRGSDFNTFPATNLEEKETQTKSCISFCSNISLCRCLAFFNFP